jgi:hypothetical protein
MLNFRRNRDSIVLFSIFFYLFLEICQGSKVRFLRILSISFKEREFPAGDISESGMNEILFIATPSQPDPGNLI